MSKVNIEYNYNTLTLRITIITIKIGLHIYSNKYCGNLNQYFKSTHNVYYNITFVFLLEELSKSNSHSKEKLCESLRPESSPSIVTKVQ